MSIWNSQYNWLCYDYSQQDLLNTITDQTVNVRPEESTGHARSVAQERRRQENEEFKRLSSLLPVARAISEKHLDKATVVRLASTYIRLHQVVAPIKRNMVQVLPVLDANLINILDGFLLCLNFSGEILYVSETVSIHLGLSQVEMCGNPIWSYVHKEDLGQMREEIGKIQSHHYNETQINFRIKSTLTKRRNKESPKCAAGYKVISMEIYCRLETGILAFCQPHTVKISNGIKISPDSIVINTDECLRIRYADAKTEEIFKITSGLSFYSLVHPEDIDIIVRMHEQLHKLGSHRTPFVRLVNERDVMCAEITAIKYNNSNRHQSELDSRTTMVITIIDRWFID